jgi:hypothetical protein
VSGCSSKRWHSGREETVSKGAADKRGRPTSSTTISGAPFNCGLGCTITQKGQTLTIENAQLADFPGKDKTKPTPAVTLLVDGRERKVIDSFSPSREIPVTAAWEGTKVKVTTGSTGVSTTTQVLSLEGKELIVSTAVSLYGEPRSEVSYRYKRK